MEIRNHRSQISFISEDALANADHKLVGSRTIKIGGVTGVTTTAEVKIAVVKLVPLHCSPFFIRCYVLNNFVNAFPNRELSVADKRFIQINDVSLNHLSGIISPGMLIGIDAYFKIVRSLAPVQPLPSGLNIVPTVFGNVIGGAESEELTDVACFSCHAFAVHTATTLQEILYPPFGFEAQGIMDDPSPAADENVNDAVVRQVRAESEFRDGNIYLKFPWKVGHQPVADNYKLAYRRLASQYEKLHNNKTLWDKYNANFQEQLDAGIIELAPKVKSKDRPYYVIPHQGVLKESSLTTKLRIVLDASSHVNAEISLNDAVHPGPVILPEVLGLQMRMREHDYLVTSDIEKAFHQIFLAESDRDSCTIMWLKNHTLPPSPANVIFYRYTRLPFGVNASPFLLAMRITLFLESIAHPLKDKILKDMYVDNLFIGCRSPDECLNIYHETKLLFEKMRMNLREYATNCPLTRSLIDVADQTKSPVLSKLLGLPWNTETDVITVPFILPSIRGAYTRRSMLSAYASTFDPLGLLAPVMVPFKILISEIFKLSRSWDDPVPLEFIPRWEKLVRDVEGLDYSVPRKVTVSARSTASCSLAIFADASALAYGVAAYAITTFADGSPTTCHLLAAKSRVVSGGSTIPRSELVAIVTAVQLAKYACEQMDTAFDKIYILSDSMIALSWIKSKDVLKTFVHNRVQAVRSIIEKLQSSVKVIEFLHTRTDENPADATSRGLTAAEFDAYNWSHGPAWLLNARAQWPVDCLQFELPNQFQREYADEVKASSFVATVIRPVGGTSCIPFHYSSDLRSTERIMLIVARFIQFKLRKLPSGPALDKWHKWLPLLKVYRNKTCCLRTSNELETLFLLEHQRVMKTQLQSFATSQDVIIDDRGILRYQGRIKKNAGDTLPALLSPNHPYTEMRLFAAHVECNHGGTEWTLSQLRRRFWMISAHRVGANRIVKSCVKCRRITAKPFPYPIAPVLPESRTTLIRPFHDCGLDYAGPFAIRIAKNASGREDGKAWFLLITCLATRAVHLELVASNSTLDFVLALEKFFSRFGIPNSFVLDNAPTFKAGAAVINENLNKQADFERLEFGRKLGDDAYKINWYHVTPYSPWKGGVYERMVAIVKKSLKRSLGGKVLDFRMLENLLLKVENIVNRRPLTKSSDCPSDVLALRPVDFINASVHVPFIPPTTSDEDPEFTVSTLETSEDANAVAVAISTRLQILGSVVATLSESA